MAIFRNLSTALLGLTLSGACLAAELPALKVANQKSTIKVLLQVSGQLEHLRSTREM